MNGKITFTDNVNITYRHIASTMTTPMKTLGAPGVAVLDYDQDGDQDIFVTNGPSAANSLYQNQFKPTGQLTFVDVAASAGVALVPEDNTGVCYGDLNNDGYDELLVLGNNSPHSLFLNNGNGTFADITQSSGINSDQRLTTVWSCAMGDVNGDGLLDVLMGKDQQFGQHNELWLNEGDNTFTDISASSGIQNIVSMATDGPALPGITWAVAMVDYDLDGDVDIFAANDQPYAELTSPQAYINVFQNDGTGKFTNVTRQVRLDRTGFWMGLAFGDFNSDGYMDVFGSNFGDYTPAVREPSYKPGRLSSRWFLGGKNGRFDDPGVGDLTATPFGWGSAATEHDNDGDTDIIYHGGLDVALFIDASNVGTVLQNDGAANFTRDAEAFPKRTTRQNVQGLAVGDLNNDGFQDVIWVADFDIAESQPLTPLEVPFESPFNADAAYITRQSPNDKLNLTEGTLSVLISIGNDNAWVQVKAIGTIGLVDGAKVNRSGIGAVIRFTPENGEPVMQPILGGASYASQDSLIASFGLGTAQTGTVEILWPGGTRNRLYNVSAGEQITFPEIPCDFTAEWADLPSYEACVEKALDQLVQQKVIDDNARMRFLDSALRAYNER